ncbi:MAG: NUDIX domain-containing protein [Treponema sp.]|nr:NUDIX domain-containing protein [Treponema sp.]
MDVIKRSVAGIAIEQGKCFIARRIPGGALGEKWEFPGGKVEPDETDETALLREYQEELGVPISIGPFLGESSFEYQGPHKVYAYRVYLKGADFKLADHTEWRWACLEEIKTLDFAESDRKLFPYLEPHLD